MAKLITCTSDAKLSETYHGLSFGNNIVLTHVLFVDDIVMVNDGS